MDKALACSEMVFHPDSFIIFGTSKMAMLNLEREEH
jgi:hypothetical protein